MGSITIFALDEALGIRSDDYREFCGLRNEAEHEAFLASQADNSRIDAEDRL